MIIEINPFNIDQRLIKQVVDTLKKERERGITI